MIQFGTTADTRQDKEYGPVRFLIVTGPRVHRLTPRYSAHWQQSQIESRLLRNR